MRKGLDSAVIEFFDDDRDKIAEYSDEYTWMSTMTHPAHLRQPLIDIQLPDNLSLLFFYYYYYYYYYCYNNNSNNTTNNNNNSNSRNYKPAERWNKYGLGQRKSSYKK